MEPMDEAVAAYVRKGWAIESRSDTQVVLAKRKKIGLFWNAVLSVGTGGLWLIVIAYRLVNRKSYRVTLTLQPDGSVVGR